MNRPTADATRGSATVLMLAGIGLVLVLTGVVVMVGVADQVRHRAGAAADAAALAAAASALDGENAACDRGADLAARNGATLVSCSITDGISDVTVAMTAPGVLAGLGPVRARARAGPASVANR
ncbi:MAG TPA: Rv3654c family TadE-like protein [Mycobacteriales bacterium]|nr:Rv3654c family TadE-like protein [Mycobacteriales bacterium]HWA67545.1 Rv3654c family TadE-like protein [Mycobacteriales bacterium]